MAEEEHADNYSLLSATFDGEHFLGEVMDYIRNLLQLFVVLFSEGVKFTYIIALVIISGVVGGLMTLLKRLIYPVRSRDE